MTHRLMGVSDAGWDDAVIECRPFDTYHRAGYHRVPSDLARGEDTDTKDVQAATQLPVFDVVTMINAAYATVVKQDFG